MLEFTIPSMTCGHCVKAVTKVLKQVDPQANVVIDLPDHSVRVRTELDRQAMIDALTEAGYPVR